MSRYSICIDAYEPKVFTAVLFKVDWVGVTTIQDQVRVVNDPEEFVELIKAWAVVYRVDNLRQKVLYNAEDLVNLQKVFRLL